MFPGVGVGGHKAGAADQSRVIQKAGNVRAATQVFRTSLGIMRQVTGDSQAHGLAVQHGAGTAEIKQASFQAMGEG